MLGFVSVLSCVPVVIVGGLPAVVVGVG